MTDIHNSHKKDGRIYAAIDLKSFYASVECHERMLDPLETNLVVADLSRTEKTICPSRAEINFMLHSWFAFKADAVRFALPIIIE